jgi:hypothetical protein
MDSYVVRIYRRDQKDPHKSVGVVERAEGEGEQAFHDLEELMAILASPKSYSGNPENRQKGKGE